METVIHSCDEILSGVVVVIYHYVPLGGGGDQKCPNAMSGILHQTLARNPLNTKISHLWKNGSLYWSVATQQWTPFLKVLRILHTTQKCWVHPLAPDVFKINTNLGKFEKITTFWTRATSWAVRFQARNPTGISLVNTSYSTFLTVRFYWSHKVMRLCTPSWPFNKLYFVPHLFDTVKTIQIHNHVLVQNVTNHP